MSNSARTQRFDVSATGESHTKTTVTARDFEFVIDEPPASGGTDDGPTPVEYLLGSWAGCLNVVAHLVADEYGFDLESVEIHLEGELDPARFLGKSDEPRPGYQEIDVTLEVEADAENEVLEEWLAEVERRCPVGDNIENETPTTLTLEH
ncbi:OsmC family protein [Natronobacterium texcoconense]|nr:OsmC family protein [Natronobacterium texcoconense]